MMRSPPPQPRAGRPSDLSRWSRRDEAGDTLIEVLIALLVIGVTTAALLGAFATSISASAEHRNLATIDTLLKSFAETATYQIQLQPNPLFASCAGSYDITVAFTVPAGYAVATSSVAYWNNATFVPGCATGSTAPQQITAFATGPNGSSDTLAFVVMDPAFAQAAPTITTASTDTAPSGTAFTFAVLASGAPSPTVTSTLSTGGALPAGITFVDNGNGVGALTGTNLVVAGTYQITFTAANALGSVTQSFTLTVTAAPAFTSSSSDTVASNSSFTFAVVAPGVPAATLTEAGSLPVGVSFASSTGILTGTAAVPAGIYPMTFTATNSIGSATQAFTLTVTAPPAFTSTNNATVAHGVTMTPFVVTTTGVPTATLTETGTLPTGVAFTSTTGTLTATSAVAAGVYPMTFTATNSAGTATQAFTLTVTAPPAFTSTNNATVAHGVTMTPFVVTTTGVPAATLTATGTLPTGVTFVAQAGGSATISGTPGITVGTYVLTIQATSAVGTTTQTFTLHVQ
jgi:type II secretory pathway pseudopilin PulG